MVLLCFVLFTLSALSNSCNSFTNIHPWWRHQMEIFFLLLALSDSPWKGQWQGALMFSLICAWTNNRANNWDASDLKCHHAHYDVTVMISVASPAIIAPMPVHGFRWHKKCAQMTHKYIKWPQIKAGDHFLSLYSCLKNSFFKSWVWNGPFSNIYSKPWKVFDNSGPFY